MSKITIFLCALLFAAAVDATFLSTRLIAAQQRVEAFVAAKIDNVERMYEEAQKRITELSGKLDKAADDFSDKVAVDVQKVVDKLEEDIKILVAGIKDVDIAECHKTHENLHNIASGVISNMTACIIDKKETALAYVENINTAVAEVLADLSAIREESRRCGENVDGVATAVKAIACTKMAGVRGAIQAAKSIPALSVNIGKMTYLLTTLKPSLAFCTTTHGLASFVRESRTIIRNTKVCVQQKIDEARRKPTE